MISGSLMNVNVVFNSFGSDELVLCILVICIV